MDDALLPYYNRELNYVRKMGSEFSEKYPKIAGRLRLDKDIVEDPHVSRLVESFAFLTAKIKHSLDDSFPELTEALMGLLYPDFHAPIPSIGIVQFASLPHLTQSTEIPLGEQLTLDTVSDDFCYYKTCHATKVLPITIDHIDFQQLPVKAPALPPEVTKDKVSQSVLKIKLSPLEDNDFLDINDDSVKFYINAQPNIAFMLHEYLLHNVVGIALARDGFDDDPLFINSSSLKSCGLGHDERAIDFDGRTSSAHRLLAEYFVMPQKFLFVELSGLTKAWEKYTDGYEVFIYFDRSNIDLIKGIDNRSLLLGCSPIVNIFDDSIEPIQAADTSGEVLLRSSDGLAASTDIYKINDVYAISSEGDKKAIQPFYGSHRNIDNDNTLYWSIRRENSSWQKGSVSHGTDTYINFVDKNYQVISPDSDWIINAEVSCTNRDLPNKLPFGPDQPVANFAEGGAGLRIKCLLPPTQTISPKLEEASRWQLVTQLSLQNFSNDGLGKLKEMLHLYNFNDSKDVVSLIDGIVDLHSEVTTARILDKGKSAMCQGTHLILTCDENYYAGNGLYLFGLIMDEFFSQFCVMNTFTQLSIKTTKNMRVELEWPPRNGRQPLI